MCCAGACRSVEGFLGGRAARREAGLGAVSERLAGIDRTGAERMTDAVTLWMLCVIVGFFLGSRKGRAVEGIAWAMILGPIGWVVIHCRDGVPRAR